MSGAWNGNRSEMEALKLVWEDVRKYFGPGMTKEPKTQAGS